MATKPLGASTVETPRKLFESALSVVQKRRARASGGTPIVARKVPIAMAENEQAAEKRALTDAARALARLWNVSPHLVR
jgi:hypothetical protein